MSSPPAPEASSRGVLSIVSLILLGVAIALALLEVGLRATGSAPALPGAEHVEDTFLPFKPRPGSTFVQHAASGEFQFEHSHNALGFRDVDHVEAKPADTFRIVGLGDSFAYGVGAAYEDTFLAILERRLNRRGGKTVEVIKMGLPRYYPELEARVLRHYGLRFSPDLVLVSVLPNDVLDTHLGPDAIAVEGGFLVSRQAEGLGAPALWLARHSHAVRFGLGAVTARSVANRTLHSGDLLRDGGAHEDDWRAMEASLTDMVKLSDSVGAKLAIVAIPQRGPWSAADGYPERRLARWADANGASFIPVLARMKRAATRQRVYWDGDGHCTAAGNAAIAEAIATHLERNRTIR